jgi:hypothetical protein
MNITKQRTEKLTKLLRLKYELDNWRKVIAIYDPHSRVLCTELLQCSLEHRIVHPRECVESLETAGTRAVLLLGVSIHGQVHWKAPRWHHSGHNQILCSLGNQLLQSTQGTLSITSSLQTANTFFSFLEKRKSISTLNNSKDRTVIFTLPRRRRRCPESHEA